jgi:16S rRNA (guanine966-N2)-methyltransferase
MRIISGIYKGKILFPPKNFNSRPTTDFAKESLFNIINNYIDINGIDVLDLYSGTGNIGFEFISRGCKHVTCVELNKQNSMHLRGLFSAPELKSKVAVVHYDALKFCKKGDLNFDIIFSDAPYNYEFTPEIPTSIFENPTLKKNSIIIVEHSAKLNFSGTEHFFRTEKYGDVNFSFFREA